MNAVQYLEASKLDELVERLTSEGYSIQQSHEPGNTGYDIIASKNGKRIAITVKARSALRKSAQDLAGLRERALHDGFDEYRVVVVNPPRDKQIAVEGLPQTLNNYLRSQGVPEPILKLSSHSRIDGINDLEVDALEASHDEFHVRGNGIVDVELGRGEGRDAISTKTDFPFIFDVVLGPHLELIKVNSLDIDTSSFQE